MKFFMDSVPFLSENHVNFCKKERVVPIIAPQVILRNKKKNPIEFHPSKIKKLITATIKEIPAKMAAGIQKVLGNFFRRYKEITPTRIMVAKKI